jgi:hypothetical protein
MRNLELIQRYKERQQSLLKEFDESNSGFISGKKLVFRSLRIVIILMLINMILGIMFHFNYNISIKPNNIFLLFFPVLLITIFARMIYTYGLKIFIYLIFLGGLASIYLSFIGGVFSNMNTEYLLLNTISIFSVFASITQIILMLFIAINKKCKTFLNLVFSINKGLGEELRNNNIKKVL